MEKLKMKVEPCSDEEQDTLDEQFCEHAYRPIHLQMHSTTSESEFLEERPSCVIFNSSVTKDEQEENCNRLPKKTEKTLVREKTEPDALPQDGIISKFSDSDDDNDINSLKYIIRNMK
ncbi:uncharacterized protein LOC143223674 isoform X4 [Tachypleus tridentatus]|uniref:uncharacterized protein LOC143223674 isoform X4 n=1 Tax=Tachypleus tridentatus TaxID=6853 RepID=UPI003FD3750F